MSSEIFPKPLILRHELAGDAHRPCYHFLPPHYWMNDPNGIFYWQGRYHVFYQFNPYGPLWGFIHWGHASSPDLIHWKDHPIALIPEEGAGDDLGCFSGCLVDDDGVPNAIYTGFVNFFDTPVLLAQAQDPQLEVWEKSPHNPILAVKPEGVNDTDFRDPYVWRQGERWQMVIGAGMADGDSAALLYESADLLAWRYAGPLFKHQTRESVTMWECPNFFPLDGKFVLLVSLFPNTQGVYYYVGNYDGRRFTPETEGFLEEGGVLYAPQVRRFEDGRTLLFGWVREGRSDEAMEEAGWAGVLSMPRELALDDRGHLISRPVEEYRQLRQTHFTLRDLELRAGRPVSLPISGRQVELELMMARGTAAVSLEVLAAPDGSEATRIICDLRQGVIRLDTTQSSLSEEAAGSVQTVELPDPNRERVTLRVLVDASVIEVWVDDALSITGRAYPTLADSEDLYLAVDKDEAQVRILSVWKLDGIWPTGSLASA